MDDHRAARAASVDTGAVYRRTQRAFATTVRGLSADELTRVVPAAPAWRVRDVLAHVVGLAADLNAQRFPGADDTGGVRWAAAQVEQRGPRSIDALLTEWDAEAPVFAAGLRLFGYETGSHFVADVHAHHQDVRHALALPRDDDALTVTVALDHYVGFIDELLGAAGWGAIELVSGVDVHHVGVGTQRARVTAPPFELLRSLSARRSADQLRALAWQGDADAFVAWFGGALQGGYALPEVGLQE